MEARLPHQVIYETVSTVFIEDVIASLRGTANLSQEIGPIFELLIPGLEVRSVTLSVSRITHESPLREAFSVGLIAIFQEKIGTEMPQIVHDLFGVDVPKDYDNIVSLMMITLIVFSAQFFFDQATKMIQDTRSKRTYNKLLKELAKAFGKDETAIHRAIEQKYARSGVGGLLKTASSVLLPSKKQNNAPVSFGNYQLSHEDVAEFPSDAQVKAAIPGPSTASMENVEIQLHAQDIDRNKRGWAAVVPVLSKRRIPMELFPPIVPADIYTREVIRGDILVESRITGAGDREPVRVHLVRLRNPA